MRTLFFITLILFAFSFNRCTSKSDKSIIYLVRHAEKDLTDTTDNPKLTEAGIARANKLVEVMKDVQINAIYSTKYIRNIGTVQPLAMAKQLEIQEYDWHNWQPIIEQAKIKPSKNILICGHGDNLLPIIDYLGGSSPIEKLEKREYDKIFKIEINNKKEITVEMTSY